MIGTRRFRPTPDAYTASGVHPASTNGTASARGNHSANQNGLANGRMVKTMNSRIRTTGPVLPGGPKDRTLGTLAASGANSGLRTFAIAGRAAVYHQYSTNEIARKTQRRTSDHHALSVTPGASTCGRLEPRSDANPSELQSHCTISYA